MGEKKKRKERKEKEEKKESKNKLIIYTTSALFKEDGRLKRRGYELFSLSLAL